MSDDFRATLDAMKPQVQANHFGSSSVLPPRCGRPIDNQQSWECGRSGDNISAGPDCFFRMILGLLLPPRQPWKAGRCRINPDLPLGAQGSSGSAQKSCYTCALAEAFAMLDMLPSSSLRAHPARIKFNLPWHRSAGSEHQFPSSLSPTFRHCVAL